MVANPLLDDFTLPSLAQSLRQLRLTPFALDKEPGKALVPKAFSRGRTLSPVPSWNR
jgi:hypothetical protein